MVKKRLNYLGFATLVTAVPVALWFVMGQLLLVGDCLMYKSTPNLELYERRPDLSPFSCTPFLDWALRGEVLIPVGLGLLFLCTFLFLLFTEQSSEVETQSKA